jgi:hypothetical protein
MLFGVNVYAEHESGVRFGKSPLKTAVLGLYVLFFWSHEDFTTDGLKTTIRNFDLVEKSILIPVCHNFHWTLIIIKNVKNAIHDDNVRVECFLFDSTSSNSSRFGLNNLKKMKIFDNNIFKSAGKPSPIHEKKTKSGKLKNRVDTINITNTPKQDDAWSCGYNNGFSGVFIRISTQIWNKIPGYVNSA